MIRALTPLIFVASVPGSIAFYERLGFTVGNTFAPAGSAEPVWAWLRCDGAHLMIEKASHPVDPEQQAVIFYVYCDDVVAKRAELIAAGVSAGEISRPFHSPKGEFRVIDPDGYALMFAHYGH